MQSTASINEKNASASSAPGDPTIQRNDAQNRNVTSAAASNEKSACTSSAAGDLTIQRNDSQNRSMTAAATSNEKSACTTSRLDDLTSQENAQNHNFTRNVQSITSADEKSILDAQNIDAMQRVNRFELDPTARHSSIIAPFSMYKFIEPSYPFSNLSEHAAVYPMYMNGYQSRGKYMADLAQHSQQFHS